MGYLFEDDELKDIPINARKKINRLRYQQVKEALRISRKYDLTDKSVADSFDLHRNTVSKIKNSKNFDKFKRGRYGLKKAT